ncbi:MAG TPA: ATP-binding protein [Gammaproteobacteria bacterium]|nr:ATP-binding protein [Gammaproteobacteria bacterium]
MPTEKRPPRRSPARKAGESRRATRARLDNDARKQMHSLQVHHVELEMQNKELRHVRGDLDDALTRYTSLYESAPVGFLTLDRHGAILQLNQAAAALLGGGHREWRKTRLDTYLAPGSWPAFSELLAGAAKQQGVRSGEAEIQRPDGSSFAAQISATYHAESESYLLALMDGTAQRDGFRRVHEAEQLAQKLLSQNRHLTQRMFELLEDDRRQIVHEMHQELGRGFASIYHDIATMLRAEHRLQPDTRAQIRNITANLAEMQNGLRRIMLRLRPTLLDVAGIGECVREYLSQWKEQNPRIACDLTLEGEFRGIPDPINVALFRVVQEAMANVAKHSKAGRVSVRLSRVAGQVNLVIDDNGEGFDVASVAPGVGLLSMRERVMSLDGQFELVSQPGRGLRVETYLPTGLTAEGDRAEARRDD